MPEPSLHRIRLAGPWQCQFIPGEPDADSRSATIAFTLGRFDTGPSSDELPCPGQLAMHRSFRCPTGLSSRHRVWLVVDVEPTVAQIVLNNRALTDCRCDPIASTDTLSGQRFEITSLLQPQNRLTIRLDVRSPEELNDWRACSDRVPASLEIASD